MKNKKISKKVIISALAITAVIASMGFTAVNSTSLLGGGYNFYNNGGGDGARTPSPGFGQGSNYNSYQGGWNRNPRQGHQYGGEDW